MNFDHIFRRFILTQSFVRGWGNPLHLQEIFRFRREKIAVRDECVKLISKENSIEILKQEINGDRLLIDGRFRSPLADHLPHLVGDNYTKAIIRSFYLSRYQQKLYRHIFKLFCLVIIG